jgi:hypothetical protein
VTSLLEAGINDDRFERVAAIADVGSATGKATRAVPVARSEMAAKTGGHALGGAVAGARCGMLKPRDGSAWLLLT